MPRKLRESVYSLKSSFNFPKSAEKTVKYLDSDATSLLAWYKFSDYDAGVITSKSRLLDSSDIKNHGKYYGNILQEKNRLSGIINDYVTLQVDNITRSYINIGPPDKWDSLIGKQGTKKFTVSAWLKVLSSINPTKTVFRFGIGGTSISLDLWSSPTPEIFSSVPRVNSVSYFATFTGANYVATTDSNVFNIGEWFHLAITHDLSSSGNQISIYINGREINYTNVYRYTNGGNPIQASGNFSGISRGDATISSVFLGGGFAGSIGDFAIWDNVLSNESIQAIYYASLRSFYGDLGSGFLNYPTRILQQQSDCLPLSYPTITRMGPGGLSGNESVIPFDDSKTIVYDSAHANAWLQFTNTPADGSTITLVDPAGEISLLPVISNSNNSLNDLVVSQADKTLTHEQVYEVKISKAEKIEFLNTWPDRAQPGMPISDQPTVSGAWIGLKNLDATELDISETHKYYVVINLVSVDSDILDPVDPESTDVGTFKAKIVKVVYNETIGNVISTSAISNSEIIFYMPVSGDDSYLADCQPVTPNSNYRKNLYDGLIIKWPNPHNVKANPDSNVGNTTYQISYETSDYTDEVWVAELQLPDRFIWRKADVDSYSWEPWQPIVSNELTPKIIGSGDIKKNVLAKNLKYSYAAKKGGYVYLDPIDLTKVIPGTEEPPDSFTAKIYARGDIGATEKNYQVEYTFNPLGTWNALGGLISSLRLSQANSEYWSSLSYYAPFADGHKFTEKELQYVPKDSFGEPEHLYMPDDPHEIISSQIEIGSNKKLYFRINIGKKVAQGICEVKIRLDFDGLFLGVDGIDNDNASGNNLILSWGNYYGHSVGDKWTVSVENSLSETFEFNSGIITNPINTEVKIKKNFTPSQVSIVFAKAVNSSGLQIEAFHDRDKVRLKQTIPGAIGNLKIIAQKNVNCRISNSSDYVVGVDGSVTGSFSGGDNYLVSYPTVLPAPVDGRLSPWLKNDLMSPHELSADLERNIKNIGLVATGSTVKGVADYSTVYSEKLEVNKITPFVDSRKDATIVNNFYSSGTPIDAYEGFSSPLKSKTQIQIDLPTISPTSFGMNAIYDANLKNVYNPIVYYNFKEKSWNKLGVGFNPAPSSSKEQQEFFENACIGFSRGVDLIQSASELAALPINNFGFPMHPKFEASEDQCLDMSSYIDKPFLLEKFVVEYDASWTEGTNRISSIQSIMYDVNSNGKLSKTDSQKNYNNKAGINSFFILNQRNWVGDYEYTSLGNPLEVWYPTNYKINVTHKSSNVNVDKYTWEGPDYEYDVSGSLRSWFRFFDSSVTDGVVTPASLTGENIVGGLSENRLLKKSNSGVKYVDDDSPWNFPSGAPTVGYESCLELDNSALGYISASVGNLLNPLAPTTTIENPNFTISMWFKPKSPNTNLLSIVEDLSVVQESKLNKLWLITGDNGELQFALDSGKKIPGVVLKDQFSLIDGKWHHAVMSFSNVSRIFKIWVDSRYVGSARPQQQRNQEGELLWRTIRREPILKIVLDDASKLRKKYFKLTNNITPPSTHIFWFGTPSDTAPDPTTPGTKTKIEVESNSTSAEIATLLVNAINQSSINYLTQALRERIYITLPADASSLGGKYFLLYARPTPGNIEVTYYVWFNVDGSSVDPGVLNATGIQVQINSGDDVSEIVAKSAAALINSEFTSWAGATPLAPTLEDLPAARATGRITVLISRLGPVTNAKNGNITDNSFSIEINQEGRDETTNSGFTAIDVGQGVVDVYFDDKLDAISMNQKYDEGTAGSVSGTIFSIEVSDIKNAVTVSTARITLLDLYNAGIILPFETEVRVPAVPDTLYEHTGLEQVSIDGLLLELSLEEYMTKLGYEALYPWSIVQSDIVLLGAAAETGNIKINHYSGRIADLAVWNSDIGGLNAKAIYNLRSGYYKQGAGTDIVLKGSNPQVFNSPTDKDFILAPTNEKVRVIIPSHNLLSENLGGKCFFLYDNKFRYYVWFNIVGASPSSPQPIITNYLGSGSLSIKVDVRRGAPASDIASAIRIAINEHPLTVVRNSFSATSIGNEVIVTNKTLAPIADASNGSAPYNISDGNFSISILQQYEEQKKYGISNKLLAKYTVNARDLGVKSLGIIKFTPDIIGSISYAEDSPYEIPSGTIIRGDQNYSLDFSGNSYLRLGRVGTYFSDYDEFAMPNFSFFAWVKIPKIEGADPVLFSINGDDGTNKLSFMIDTADDAYVLSGNSAEKPKGMRLKLQINSNAKLLGSDFRSSIVPLFSNLSSRLVAQNISKSYSIITDLVRQDANRDVTDGDWHHIGFTHETEEKPVTQNHPLEYVRVILALDFPPPSTDGITTPPSNNLINKNNDTTQSSDVFHTRLLLHKDGPALQKITQLLAGGNIRPVTAIEIYLRDPAIPGSLNPANWIPYSDIPSEDTVPLWHDYERADPDGAPCGLPGPSPYSKWPNLDPLRWECAGPSSFPVAVSTAYDLFSGSPVAIGKWIVLTSRKLKYTDDNNIQDVDFGAVKGVHVGKRIVIRIKLADGSVFDYTENKWMNQESANLEYTEAGKVWDPDEHALRFPDGSPQTVFLSQTDEGEPAIDYEIPKPAQITETISKFKIYFDGEAQLTHLQTAWQLEGTDNDVLYYQFSSATGAATNAGYTDAVWSDPGRIGLGSTNEDDLNRGKSWQRIQKSSVAENTDQSKYHSYLAFSQSDRVSIGQRYNVKYQRIFSLTTSKSKLKSLRARVKNYKIRKYRVPSQYFEGKIADVTIWNEKLDNVDDNVRNLYKARLGEVSGKKWFARTKGTGRDLVTYGHWCIYGGVNGASASIDSVLSSGLSRELNTPATQFVSGKGIVPFDGAPGSIVQVTGSYVLEGICKRPINHSSGLSYRVGTSANLIRSQAFYKTNHNGTRTGQDNDIFSSRALFNAVPGTKLDRKYYDLSHELRGFGKTEMNVYENYNQISPYVLMPNDKLVFGWQASLPFDFRRATLFGPGPHMKLAPFASINNPTKMRITLYGSYIQNDSELHDDLNQNLTSNAVHEAIQFESPVFDKFQTDDIGYTAGSYTDDVVMGKMLRGGQYAQSFGNSELGTLKSVFNRQKIASVAEHTQGSLGSQLRGVKLVDENERFFDTVVASPADYHTRNGYGVIEWSHPLFMGGRKMTSLCVGEPKASDIGVSQHEITNIACRPDGWYEPLPQGVIKLTFKTLWTAHDAQGTKSIKFLSIPGPDPEDPTNPGQQIEKEIFIKDLLQSERNLSANATLSFPDPTGLAWPWYVSRTRDTSLLGWRLPTPGVSNYYNGFFVIWDKDDNAYVIYFGDVQPTSQYLTALGLEYLGVSYYRATIDGASIPGASGTATASKIAKAVYDLVNATGNIPLNSNFSATLEGNIVAIVAKDDGVTDNIYVGNSIKKTIITETTEGSEELPQITKIAFQSETKHRYYYLKGDLGTSAETESTVACYVNRAQRAGLNYMFKKRAYDLDDITEIDLRDAYISIYDADGSARYINFVWSKSQAIPSSISTSQDIINVDLSGWSEPTSSKNPWDEASVVTNPASYQQYEVTCLSAGSAFVGKYFVVYDRSNLAYKFWFSTGSTTEPSLSNSIPVKVSIQADDDVYEVAAAIKDSYVKFRDGNFGGKYFIINALGNAYKIWYKIRFADPATVEPGPSGPTSVPVEIYAEDTANDIALRTKNVINDELDDVFTASIDDDKRSWLIIERTNIGNELNATIGTLSGNISFDIVEGAPALFPVSAGVKEKTTVKFLKDNEGYRPFTIVTKNSPSHNIVDIKLARPGETTEMSPGSLVAERDIHIKKINDGAPGKGLLFYYYTDYLSATDKINSYTTDINFPHLGLNATDVRGVNPKTLSDFFEDFYDIEPTGYAVSISNLIDKSPESKKSRTMPAAIFASRVAAAINTDTSFEVLKRTLPELTYVDALHAGHITFAEYLDWVNTLNYPAAYASGKITLLEYQQHLQSLHPIISNFRTDMPCTHTAYGGGSKSDLWSDPNNPAKIKEVYYFDLSEPDVHGMQTCSVYVRTVSGGLDAVNHENIETLLEGGGIPGVHYSYPIINSEYMRNTNYAYNVGATRIIDRKYRFADLKNDINLIQDGWGMVNKFTNNQYEYDNLTGITTYNSASIAASLELVLDKPGVKNYIDNIRPNNLNQFRHQNPVYQTVGSFKRVSRYTLDGCFFKIHDAYDKPYIVKYDLDDNVVNTSVLPRKVSGRLISVNSVKPGSPASTVAEETAAAISGSIFSKLFSASYSDGDEFFTIENTQDGWVTDASMTVMGPPLTTGFFLADENGEFYENETYYWKLNRGSNGIVASVTPGIQDNESLVLRKSTEATEIWWNGDPIQEGGKPYHENTEKAIDTTWLGAYPFESKYASLVRGKFRKTNKKWSITKWDDDTGEFTKSAEFANNFTTMIITGSNVIRKIFDPSINNVNSYYVLPLLGSGGPNLSGVYLNNLTPDVNTSFMKFYFGSGDRWQKNPELELQMVYSDGYDWPSYIPKIRGWKYGLKSALPENTTAIYRHDRYGQFRDMLEQRHDSSFYRTITGGVWRGLGRPTTSPVTVRFVNQDGNLVTPPSTSSQNVSRFCTSSLPFFDDGIPRNR